MTNKKNTDNNPVSNDGRHEDDTITNGASQDDIVFEPENNEETAGLGSSSEKKLREKLKKAVAEKQEYLDGWQRAKAELVNARKGFDEDKKKYVSFANEGLIAELISVLDSFDMAFANKEAWEKVDANWRMGVEHIHNQFMNILKQNGVELISEAGIPFDNMLHEVSETTETDDAKNDGIIESVIRPGYMLNGRVIRPAHVRVFEHKS